MSEDEIIDFGMVLEIVLGKDDEPFLVFALERCLAIVGRTLIAYQFGVVLETILGHDASLFIRYKSSVRTFHA